MTATMLSEWIKLRTVRVHTVMLVIAAAFPLVIVALVTSFSSSPEDLVDDDYAEFVTGVSLVAVMLLGAVAAISLTSEYSHGTIRPTFAATPSRARVVVAKWLVNTVVAAAAISALLAVSWALGAFVLSSRDTSVSLSMEDGSLGSMFALVALGVVVTWFALGLGLVLRNAPATVTILLLWPLLIESLLAGVLTLIGAGGLVRWLPYQASIQAVAPDFGDDTLGRPQAFVWFGVVSLAVIGIGLVLDRRRDA